MGAVLPTSAVRELEVRRVLRDGKLVAVLMAIDQGDSFTVVTEVFADGAETASRKPYTFASADEGLAFMAEALTTFTYLGCEVRRQ
jgi:hypothetical protein